MIEGQRPAFVGVPVGMEAEVLTCEGLPLTVTVTVAVDAGGQTVLDEGGSTHVSFVGAIVNFGDCA